MAPPPPPLREVFFCPLKITLEPDVWLRFFKKGKCSELNFRNFWPGSRHLRPFPDRPDRPHCPARLAVEPDAQLNFSKEEKCLELNFESSVLVSDTFYRFQIVQTVTLSSHINFGSRGSIEILKIRKMLELKFRKFNWFFQKKEYVLKICPGFTQLLPFPDCPEREIVQLYYLWK